MALRLGALDEVSLEADERTELEREKQVRPSVVNDGMASGRLRFPFRETDFFGMGGCV